MRRGFTYAIGLAPLLFLSSAPARAEAFTDPSTGFSVTVPAGFAIRSQRTDPNHEILVDIVSETGQPPVAGRSEALCAAGFRRNQPGAVSSQAELNALPALRERVAEARTILAGQGLQTETVESIKSSEFAGFEVISVPTSGPDHRNVRIYMAIMDRVIGRIDIVSATTKQALPDALPMFRAIRDGTRPPAR
ncbi:MAG TPA: hypothetical protein VGU70_05000 [Methylobacterium sp.]|jgi:protein TonB|uniref:hypothetical protein n=1 Tax=Methylorubrum sp. B1-46 TaxID=2897334 RepID=UPI001E524F09|nr:hypothetical protein [Methylorubrum sp. B1-46]UGB24051.1 hypothetical protein LPC10_13815 [Methylorubrum sp. B1-46]HEV2542103.1 hypothetical protein [Methylobacterium sp.]